MREIAECIEASNKANEGVTLGAVVPANHNAADGVLRVRKKGLSRIIDRYGPAMPLPKLVDILARTTGAVLTSRVSCAISVSPLGSPEPSVLLPQSAF